MKSEYLRVLLTDDLPTEKNSNVEANSKCPYFGNSFEIDTKADTAGDDGVLWGFVRGNGCALVLLLKD